MNRKSIILLAGSYFFVSNLCFAIIDFLPHPIRILLFRLVIGRLGKTPFIDHKTYFRYPWKIIVGDKVAINRGCEFLAACHEGNGTITIGNNVVFGPNVKIYAGGHDYSTLGLAHIAQPVVIGDNVWVGADSIILHGVTLGEGAVVGAGSVVTENIPPYSVAVGNPARIIKQRRIAK